MYIPSEVQTKYLDIRPFVAELERRANESIIPLCREFGYAHAARQKTLESLVEKLESGRFKSWSDIDDLFACAIVVPTLSEEPRVLKELRDRFVDVATKERGSGRKAPDVFRFDATRFIGRLKPPPDRQSDTLHSLLFEVQIRTAFEHAWIVTTHAFSYKSDELDWRRMRVAAQLKAAVEQLDGLVLAFQASTNSVVTHEWPDVILKSNIANCLKTLVLNQKIPKELAPKDWSRVADNALSLIRAGRPRGANLDESVAKCLAALESEVDRLSPEQFPRSISLVQLLMAVGTREGLLGPDFYKLHPLITTELMQMYPETRRILHAFGL